MKDVSQGSLADFRAERWEEGDKIRRVIDLVRIGLAPVALHKGLPQDLVLVVKRIHDTSSAVLQGFSHPVIILAGPDLELNLDIHELHQPIVHSREKPVIRGEGLLVDFMVAREVDVNESLELLPAPFVLVPQQFSISPNSHPLKLDEARAVISPMSDQIGGHPGFSVGVVRAPQV
jgi:hypothetical protein